MQTIEKALHQPMPFTTGGQTITDRLTAAKHSLAGSQLGKTICKATTEELMAPKKKHLDYLLHCTQEPNVSIPSMANLLIERTQNPNWTVVYKALITIHNIMCYGNERFSQYLASCNTTFNLGSFLDKNSAQGHHHHHFSMDYTNSSARHWASLDSVLVGYDMSQHVRRYGKYISEKIYTYRLCAFDFCKVKRGREDGLLRTMNTDKLLKTLPILQNQIDALLEFQVTSAELNNGVINCSFILLFRDLIRLFACYNDGIINLLEKYFDMNKKQCREALDAYKSFLLRLDKVASFLKVAESVGIDRTEIPDLTRAPASLLEALEAHLIYLEGGKAPPTAHHEQFTAAMAQSTPLFSSAQTGIIDDSAKQKYLEEEKERLRLFEEQRKRQAAAAGSSATDTGHSFNPFATPAAAASAGGTSGRSSSTKPSDDLLSLFDPMPAATGAGAGATAATSGYGTAATQPITLDPTNPFAQNVFQQQQQPASVMSAASTAPPFTTYPNMGATNAFGADFSTAFSGGTMAAAPTTAPLETNVGFNPFLVGGTDSPASAAPPSVQWPSTDEETENKQWLGKISQDSGVSPAPPQWASITPSDLEGGPVGAPSWGKNGESSESGDETTAPAVTEGQQQQPQQQQLPNETISSALRNPFSAMQQNAQALHTADASATAITQQQPEIRTFGALPSNASSTNASPVHFGMTTQASAAPPVPPPPPPPQQQQMMHNQNLAIYDQTPFSHTDGSYSSSPIMPHYIQQQGAATAAAHPGMQNMPGGTANLSAYGAQPPVSSVSPVATSQTGKFTTGDLDSALSSLADNLSVSGKGAANQGKPVQWSSPGGVRPPAGGTHPMPQPQYGAMPPQQWPPMGVYAPQPGMYAQQPMMSMYPQAGYNPQMQQLGAPPVYGMPPGQAPPQPGQPQQVPPQQRPYM